ncbi:hypothetical protein [uncultured Altererythrobacter sp.]|uniref:hypothetical protein n=1 Tax=uncultured Altererythrobacter sp. TaxID=500840 RepID=UPI0025F07E71|nr:hypothetical protein [uncultured Altererythrobacter sp.]
MPKIPRSDTGEKQTDQKKYAADRADNLGHNVHSKEFAGCRDNNVAALPVLGLIPNNLQPVTRLALGAILRRQFAN